LGDACFKVVEKRKEHKLRRANWLIAERPGKVVAFRPPARWYKLKDESERARKNGIFISFYQARI